MSLVSDAVLEHSFFFTPVERERILHMEVTQLEPSLITGLFRPFFFFISNKLIPDSVAPNTIALIGVVFTLQAMQVMQLYFADPGSRPYATAIVSLLLLLSSMCSAVDGVHAVRCRSYSVVGRVFTEVCDSVKYVFVLLAVLPAIDVTDPITQWYIVMTMQFIRLCHVFIRVSSIVGKRMTQVSYLFGTSETMLFHLSVIVMRTFAPVDWSTFFKFVTRENAMILYCTVVVLGATSVLLLRNPGTSIFPLFWSLLAVAAPTFLLPIPHVTSSLSIIGDAAVLGVIGVEVFISALAGRTIHAFVIVIALLSTFNTVWALAAAAFYLTGVVLDLSFYSRIPIFVPCRNVYIDGVFDLCHIGHKRLMEFALKHGNRLIVGVMSDEDCEGYKRKPIMSTEERCTEVRHCKWVSQVIPGAPCFGLTKEFIKKYNIHVVVHGAEYDKPEDKYYRVAREMGIAVPAPRTQGISTSELIRRIKSVDAHELRAKDKLSGASTVQEPDITDSDVSPMKSKTNSADASFDASEN